MSTSLASMATAVKEAPAQPRMFKTYSRVLHVPIWIWVFFILPGHLTFDLFARGPDRRHWIWLSVVAAVVTWRGILARLPGAEAGPYITRYGVEQPNLPYRVVCYTAAWIALLVPFTLNLIGLAALVVTGKTVLEEFYTWLYYPLAAAIVVATALNRVPRTRRSTIREPQEKAWFYSALWIIGPTQLANWAAWRLGPALGFAGFKLDCFRLAVLMLVAATFLALSWKGKLPRTRRNPPLTPDE
ncbi:MAG: hypothetical protein HY646_03395 [Acidobacteria bacterium]|nr:hypothetical protein [Acidobacteriota bacterium]